MSRHPGNPNLGPGPGRPRGAANKSTIVGREFARGILDDPTGRAKLLEQYRRGKLAPGVLIELMHYAYGKPKDVVEASDSLGKLILEVERR